VAPQLVASRAVLSSTELVSVSDRGSPPCQSTGNTTFTYIFVSKFLYMRREDRSLLTVAESITRIQSAVNVFMNQIPICYP
jgi:hypothetical protein